MDYFRYSALGNDYLIIDPNQTKIAMTINNIKLICDRHFGIGGDGILYGPVIQDEKFFLKIFNPDGSEAEKSGNGIRIFSRFLKDEKYINQNYFKIYTLSGSSEVEILNEHSGSIRINMGKPCFDSTVIPVLGKTREVIQEEINIDGETIKFTCVSVGNPHCIIPLEVISKEKVLQLGSKIETHSLFPNKINVQLLKIIDRSSIKIEIWERGAGYTLASGSSSCAAASVAYKLGLVDKEIKVHMPGGILEVMFDSSGHIYITGTAMAISKGSFLEDFIEKLSIGN
jgi:diaminopimelate epimerase